MAFVIFNPFRLGSSVLNSQTVVFFAASKDTELEQIDAIGSLLKVPKLEPTTLMLLRRCELDADTSGML